MDSHTSFGRSEQWMANARFSEGLKTLAEARRSPSDESTRKALALFQEAATIDPAFGRAHFYIGIASELYGRHKDAIAAFESLLQDGRAPRLELLYNLALAWFHLYESQAYAKALAYVDTLIRETQERSAPNDQKRRTATVLLARTLQCQVLSHRAMIEDEKQAAATRHDARTAAESILADLEKSSSELEPEVVKDVRWGAWNALGHIYQMAGRNKDVKLLQAAEGAFTRALEFSPRNFRVLSNLAANHLFIGKMSSEPLEHFEKSKEIFRRVLALRPHYDYAHYRLAELAFAQKDFDEALAQVGLAKEHPSEMTPEKPDDLEQRIRGQRPTPPSRAIFLDDET